VRKKEGRRKRVLVAKESVEEGALTAIKLTHYNKEK